MLLASLLVAPLAYAQNPYTVYGGVKQPDGTPASRVTVSISGQSGLSLQAFADDMGHYEIPNLPRGRYYLTAVNSADPDQFTDPVLVDLGRDMSTRVVVHLFLRYRSKVVETPRKQSGVVSLKEEAQQIPKPARNAFDQAVALRGGRKFDQSLKQFGKAIEIYPEYFQAFAERGHLRIGMNQPAEASLDFARALEINGRYGPALRGAGLCEFQQGKFADAIRYLSRAAETEPDNATNYLFIGAASVALDRREEAHTALQKALNINPAGSARAHVHLANLYIKENRAQDAILEIEAYLKTIPNAPDADRLRQVLTQLRAGNRQP